MTVTGSPVGLYPSGDIHEVTSTHAVSNSGDHPCGGRAALRILSRNGGGSLV